jgi:hypothetical protein
MNYRALIVQFNNFTLRFINLTCAKDETSNFDNTSPLIIFHFEKQAIDKERLGF